MLISKFRSCKVAVPLGGNALAGAKRMSDSSVGGSVSATIAGIATCAVTALGVWLGHLRKSGKSASTFSVELLDRLQARVDALEAGLATSQSEHASCREMVGRQAQQIRDQDARIEIQSRQIAEQYRRITEQNTRIKEQDNHIAELSQTVDRLSGALAARVRPTAN